MRKILVGATAVLTAILLAGCATTPATEAPSSAQHYYLNPSIEFSNYRTYGFLQVTAVRYQDPEIASDKRPNGIFGRKEQKRPDVHHTDELIWRVLQGELQNKGYAQITPESADLWVIYYGGPRPIAPGSQVRIKPNAFDEYFARNELNSRTFFIDVIDAKEGTLIYRGWDNGTFGQRNPNPDLTISATRNLINFLPAKR